MSNHDSNPSFNRDLHLAQAETHEVFNQPSPLEPWNIWNGDGNLRHWIRVFGGDWAQHALRDYGERCGGELVAAGFEANRNPPELHTHDRFGHRSDEVSYHPAYHRLMDTAITAGIHCLPWEHPRPGAHVARAGLEYLHMHADAGSACPLTMTFAAVPAIRETESLARNWLPKITARHYDPRNVPFFDKQGVTIGMAMTEKQGGSDVRANTTRAYPLGRAGSRARRGPGERYELIGHKWFCSAPMCDAFLTLAQTENGLSCFLMPRWREDGHKNAIHIQRLKDKLGNRSNASAEIELRGAEAWLLGEEGRGVATIIDMVTMTRFDCAVGSAALTHAAVAQAIHHSDGRSAFGKPLHDHPLMQNVLADLAIESEASLALALRLAHALDNADRDPGEQQLARIVIPIAKYWVCKRAPQAIYEAMECIGGVGYVEQSILPRHYREAPVNAIWEGSGNIQCLDALRAIAREPEVLEALLAEIDAAHGHSPAFDRTITALRDLFTDQSTLEYRARALVDQLAVALQASLLIRHSEPVIADAFVVTRLLPHAAANYGTLPRHFDCAAILARARPAP